MQEGRHYNKPILKLALRVFLTSGLAEAAREALLVRGRLHMVRLNRRRSAASGRVLSTSSFSSQPRRAWPTP